MEDIQTKDDFIAYHASLITKTEKVEIDETVKHHNFNLSEVDDFDDSFNSKLTELELQSKNILEKIEHEDMTIKDFAEEIGVLETRQDLPFANMDSQGYTFIRNLKSYQDKKRTSARNALETITKFQQKIGILEEVNDSDEDVFF